MYVKHISNLCYSKDDPGRFELQTKIQLPLFQTGSLKLKIVQSQSYSNTSKVMRFGNVYFAPLLLSLQHCGCIYDSKNMKFNGHMNN